MCREQHCITFLKKEGYEENENVNVLDVPSVKKSA